MFDFINPKRKIIRRYWLYIIALEQGRYYVGITERRDPYIRMKQHGGPKGAEWTRRYKPLKPLQVIRLDQLGTMSLMEAERHEQATFEEYRRRYGLRKVRGGKVTLSGPILRIGSLYLNRWSLGALSALISILILVCLIYLTTH